MILFTIGHDFHFELENICRIFYPFEKIRILKTFEETEGETVIYTEMVETATGADLTVRLTTEKSDTKWGAFVMKGASDMDGLPDFKDACELTLAVTLFQMLVRHTGYRPDWGALTGVRPAKLMRRLTDTVGEEAAIRHFTKNLLVSDEKTALCQRVSQTEDEIIRVTRPDSFSLYIAIPFCPTRCAYCSFVSHSVERSRQLVPKYVELLCEELKATGQAVKRLGLRLETVYMGGGTPTTLSAEQLTAVMDAVKENFDLTYLREYTVEAGRPDTITPEKLTAIKVGGADRISINPQTMNDEVLLEIGRKHTAKQTVEAFQMAREAGFDNINMDLIAGLPLDTVESFTHTVDQILELDPESVTIHTLAMKRSSKLTQDHQHELLSAGEAVGRMLHIGSEKLSKAGILPYYMYRQSKTVGGLENVGYSKAGCEGFYNVYIMDETHTILACGASGVTKLKQPGTNYLERVCNFKYPYEYISRFDEILARKEQIGRFYEQFVKLN